MAFAAGLVYQEDWAAQLQMMLDESQVWKEICNVVYLNTRTYNNPYLSDPTVQSHTRGTPYTMQTVSQTNETVNIVQSNVLAQFIDRADLAQSRYTDQMYLARRQGILLNESIESALFADHANWTNFTNASIGGSAGNITVSASNIDDIVRGIKRVIRTAGGNSLMKQNGAFIVWRPADFEILEAYAQANGFSLADQALKNGTELGYNLFGVYHYFSNLLTANHLFAGVRNLEFIGILRDTYGQIMVDDKDPAQTSGVSVVSRVDFGIKTWTNFQPVLFDVTVA